MKNNGLVLTGALIGGIVGHFLFFWIAQQGFYALILPGGLVGIAAGIFRATSKAVPVICGILAVVIGLLTEWRFAPFTADESPGYFLTHLHQLRPVTLVLIAVGALIAVWVPFRRLQPVEKRTRSDD